MDPQFWSTWAAVAAAWVFGFPAFAAFVLGTIALDARLRRNAIMPNTVEPALA